MPSGSRMPWLIRLAKATYGVWAKRHYSLSLKNEELIKGLDGPVLLLSNHVSVYDPIYISLMLKRHVRWVAGAYMFKMKFLRAIFSKGCTAIAKQQGRSDFATVRAIQSAFRSGDIVGLFPAGTRTWDGDPVPFTLTTLARMIKMFRVPVLFVHLEGGFAQYPRWADHIRKGKVAVTLYSLLKPEQTANLKPKELEDLIRDNISFSNDKWKTTTDYSYSCSARAEGLQRVLYMCPCCGKVSTIGTKDNKIFCNACGAEATLNNMDDIVSSSFPFTTIHQWHEWEASKVGSLETLGPEPGVLFQEGDANNLGKIEVISKNISVRSDKKNLYVKCPEVSQEYSLAYKDMSSLIINAKQTIELFINDKIYRIRLEGEASSLKYQEYYQAVRAEIGGV